MKKYFTYKDIENKYEQAKDVPFDYRFSSSVLRNHLLRKTVDNTNRNTTIHNLLSLPEEHVKFLKGYIDIFSKNNTNKYALLNRLITIYTDTVILDKHTDPTIVRKADKYVELDLSQKMTILNDSLDIFKSLRNPDMLLNAIFAAEDAEYYSHNAFTLLLNEKYLLQFLLANKYLLDPKELRKENKRYNKINKDFFKNMKTNIR